MCGRYLTLSSGEAMARWFGFEGGPAWTARYNVAPSQDVPVVRQAEAGDRRECVLMRWGLVPSWAKEVSFNFSTINARAETLASKPTFRTSFKRRRCLVPADGFYEWQATGGKHKQPFVIRPVDSKPLAASRHPFSVIPPSVMGAAAFIQSLDAAPAPHQSGATATPH